MSQPTSNVEEQPTAAPGAAEAPPQSAQQAPAAASSLQQEPVNFGNAAYGRRVTIGGVHGNNNPTADRRGSLASVGMDELFGRRTSMPFDMNMDNIFARRDSMDSTSAALDAAFLDLTRRRSSLFLGGALGNDLQDPGSGMMSRPSMTGSFSGTSMMRNTSFGSVPFERNPSLPGAFAMPPPSMPPSLTGAPANNSGNMPDGVNSIAARQQQLQQQQRELEQYQKVLEIQRQQLLNNMQERSYAQMPDSMNKGPAMGRFGGGSMGFGSPNAMGQGSMGYGGSMGLGGSLGLGSVHSQGSQGSVGGMPLSAQQSRMSGGNQNWWVCQICNSKAFASREEAMAHEQICQSAPHQMQQSLGMQDLSQRSFSMGMDSSAHSLHSMHSAQSFEPNAMSNGPFAMLPKPMPLAMPSDKDWLTPLHCFVRQYCVEIFTASEQDVATPSKGKRKPIQVGQIGIRCPHCHEYDASTSRSRERGSVYYPTTIASIYNATMNLLQRHLHSCPAVPADIMRRYETLKADDARSGTSKRYWVESARSLGLVDTPNGIRHSALRPPPLPGLSNQQAGQGQDAARRNSNEFFSTNSNAVTGKEGDANGESAPAKDSANTTGDAAVSQSEKALTDSAPLVTPDDKPYATTFSFHLISQMQPCSFTEADRLGKRKGLPPGFPGLACRHCFGGYGSGRFFPSSIKTLSDTSKTLNVLHNHMMRCRKCPAEVRETLERLRTSHDEERAKMKFGSQKAFFARIWERLHGKGQPAAYKRPLAPAKPTFTQQQVMMGYPPNTGVMGPPLGAGMVGPPHGMNQMTMGAIGQNNMVAGPVPKRQKTK